jgi:sterol desaturase/sphingolipid hydroxylase (fatty acid hydroxylase superfamily)
MCHYGIHRLFHTVPLLWRAHRLHHSDPDVDIITELKHHPLEYLISGLLDVAAVVSLGLSPLVIVISALVAPAVSLMSHTNIKLPGHIDHSLRLLIVTPAMHRIHHSSYQPETDSNYSALFSFWDRLFGTYVEKPRDGFEHMQLGLKEFRAERDLWLDRMLLQPFVKNPEPDTTATPDTDNG